MACGSGQEEAGMHSPMSVVRKSAKDPGANTTTAYVKNPQGPPLDYSFLGNLVSSADHPHLCNQDTEYSCDCA
eukprot:3515235-Rhodomonas_salina.2